MSKAWVKESVAFEFRKTVIKKVSILKIYINSLNIERNCLAGLLRQQEDIAADEPERPEERAVPAEDRRLFRRLLPEPSVEQGEERTTSIIWMQQPFYNFGPTLGHLLFIELKSHLSNENCCNRVGNVTEKILLTKIFLKGRLMALPYFNYWGLAYSESQ